MLLHLGALPGVREPVGVQPQGGHRGPQPVRQVGDELTLGGEQVLDAGTELVEHATRPLDLRRPGRHDARGEIPRTQTTGGPGKVSRRGGEPGGDPVPDQRRRPEEEQPHPTEEEPGPEHALPEQVVGYERADDSDPVGARDGLEHLHAADGPGAEGPPAFRQLDRRAAGHVRSDDRAVRQVDGRASVAGVDEQHLGLQPREATRPSGEQGDALGVAPTGVDGAVGRDGAGHQAEGDEERDEHHGRHRQPVAQEQAPHGPAGAGEAVVPGVRAPPSSGAVSRTPTPRTRCR